MRQTSESGEGVEPDVRGGVWQCRMQRTAVEELVHVFDNESSPSRPSADNSCSQVLYLAKT